MFKYISTYSPIIGLLLIIIVIASTEIFGQSYTVYNDGSDGAGRGMHSGLVFILKLFLYIPILLLYLISIIRLIKNHKVFDESISWTVIHLLPILFFVITGLSSLENKIKFNSNKKKHERLAKYERSFTDCSDDNKFLIIKQNFIFYATDRRNYGKRWPPYIRAIGKINNGVFESIYNKEELSSFGGELNNMKDPKGESIFEVYKYTQITYDKDTYTEPEEYYPSLHNLK